MLIPALCFTLLMVCTGKRAPLQFPQSENPRTADPPLWDLDSSQVVHTITLFDQVALSQYNSVETSHFVPPPASMEWGRVVLSWNGSVKGVQFDRYGALWVDGVELLRTTTPEPDSTGIHWNITRDVTEYSMLFRKKNGGQNDKNNLTAALAIPTLVTPTYTGVLYISAKLEFFAAEHNGDHSDHHPPQPDSNRASVVEEFPQIIPLKNPIVNSSSATGNTPWSVMTAIPDGQAMSSLFSLPTTVKDAVRGYIDLYASAHACEEFWYSNPPANSTGGVCGAGSHRQLQIRINGQVAGIASPFPVIYTGGVNPLLWRPLTGIMSFDIPPYRFDISPFLGVVNTRKPVNISAEVISNSGGNSTGVWYLDAVLVLYENAGDFGERLTGSAPDVSDSGLDINVKSNPSQTVWNITAKRTLHIHGRLRSSATGEIFESRVWSTLHSNNINTANDTTSNSKGAMRGEYRSGWSRQGKTAETMKREEEEEEEEESSRDAITATTSKSSSKSSIRSITFEYPYLVDSTETQDNTTFNIIGNVSYARAMDVQLNKGYRLGWTNAIEAYAEYNRSLSNHTDINRQLGKSLEAFRVVNAAATPPRASSRSPCFSNELRAKDGYLVKRTDHPGTCRFPRKHGYRLNGHELYINEKLWCSE